MNKLSVMDTAADGYGAMIKNFDMFLRLAALPMLVTLALWYAPDKSPFWDWRDEWAVYFIPAATLIPWSIFAVSWHRFLVRNRYDMRWPVQFRLGLRELKYLGLSTYVLIAMYVLPSTSFVMTLEWTGRHAATMGFPLFLFLISLTFAAWLGIFVRFSFVLSAVSVDAGASLTRAWSQLRGSFWQLYLAVLLAFLPITAFLALIGSGSYHILTTVFTDRLFLCAILYLLSALVIAVLSLAYRRLSGWSAGENQEVEKQA